MNGLFKSAARQPDIIPQLRSLMIMGIAFIEGTFLFSSFFIRQQIDKMEREEKEDSWWKSINPTINIGPVTFGFNHVSHDLVDCGVVFGFIYWASRNMTLKPKGKQMGLWVFLWPLLVDLQNLTLVKATWKTTRSFPCLFLFMVLANNLGLMAKLQTTDGQTLDIANANLQFDLALSFGIILMTHIEGIQCRGIKNI